MLVVAVFEMINGFITHELIGFNVNMVWFSLYIIIIAFPAIWFLKSNGVPGAGDNMAAIGILYVLGKILNEYKRKGAPIIENTRIKLISFDAEEAGIRGSRRYVTRHIEELKKDKAININIDGVYSADDLKVITRDLNGFVKNDPDLVEKVIESANQLNIGIGRLPIVVPFGSTDSASFVKKGIPSTSLFAVKTDNMQESYHTMKDTVEVVDPKSIEYILATILNFLKKFD